MENFNTLTIETERLLLVPISIQYAQEIFKEFTPEITTYMFPKSPKHITETEKSIQESIDKNTNWKNYQIAILDKITQEFLGCWGLHFKNPEAPELGIRIKKWAFGKKIGREAVAGLADRAQNNLEFKYLYYPVDKDNIPSRKIAESLWWIIERDADGEERVQTKDTLDPNRKLNGVEYKIPKK